MKGNKNFWRYIGGRFVSLNGSGIQTIALPLYVLDSTGSGTLMGILSMFILIPILMTAPFAGVIGDRSDRRNIMIAMDFGRGILVCILAVIAMRGNCNIYILFILQIFISIMDSIFNSSSMALMPDLVSKDELMEANSIKSGFDAASNIIGPMLGGVIYGIWGIQAVFYINSASFVISAVFSILITYRKKAVQTEKINMRIFLHKNHEILKFIVSKKGLFQLFTFAMFANFFLAPLFDVVMPYVLKKEVGFTSEQYGYIAGFLAVGALFGNISILMYFKKLGLKQLMRYGFVFETILRTAVCGLVFPSIVSIYGGATWMLFISIGSLCMMMEFFNAFVNTSIGTNLQNLVPDKMRSRFFAIFGMFAQGAMPLGTLLFGILLDLVKYYNILIAMNLLVIIAVIIFLLKACDEAYEAKI
ncbi:major facilitator superfamily MFS_1 [Clostridium sp. DL-VIII]|uniref:MFS transporter n=1 Tax=Clostridium sp. DL-VIII TaxID=641107 RepID=UPI00023B080E|nr:MFS transporter [Clostridium sp. DL-VIII]EHJ01100.1 major facilitator superfamily MFS_1 [Clostridium sp. DL-VIII]